MYTSIYNCHYFLCSTLLNISSFSFVLCTKGSTCQDQSKILPFEISNFMRFCLVFGFWVLQKAALLEVLIGLLGVFFSGTLLHNFKVSAVFENPKDFVENDSVVQGVHPMEVLFGS
ncbi:hypothetical protein NE237_026549 [Protea cynaroides]|uniref:Uncharacterized protein n=1 Tax=Protea cynaroides TaxID=273540 RepID=A0A9Q0H6X1_9MAGN|nr:hypothetical protein NE237_026549 [Protea cynaroides]